MTLQRISKKQFFSHLRSRTLEDVRMMTSIERYLVKKRGYVFRIPKKGEPTILLVSGGLDSITTWALLMEEFGLNVYPLTFDRGEKRREKERQALRFFSKLYQHRYPHLFHEPMEIDLGTKAITLPIETAPTQLHPEVVLRSLSTQSGAVDVNVSFGAFLLLPMYGKMYADFLNHTHNLHIKTIFCAVTTDDGELVPHQAFTAIRSAMFYLCSATGNSAWQFASAVFEKETGLYFGKKDLVAWATRQGIPLERTWSCYHAGKYQCGGEDCITCGARRQAFIKAGVPDRTIYRPMRKQRLLSKLQSISKFAPHPLKLYVKEVLEKRGLY